MGFWIYFCHPTPVLGFLNHVFSHLSDHLDGILRSGGKKLDHLGVKCLYTPYPSEESDFHSRIPRIRFWALFWIRFSRIGFFTKLDKNASQTKPKSLSQLFVQKTPFRCFVLKSGSPNPSQKIRFSFSFFKTLFEHSFCFYSTKRSQKVVFEFKKSFQKRSDFQNRIFRTGFQSKTTKRVFLYKELT